MTTFLAHINEQQLDGLRALAKQRSVSVSCLLREGAQIVLNSGFVPVGQTIDARGLIASGAILVLKG